VPKVTLGDDPDKCIGGGPPITVPDDNGTICTGSLGATSFTFGLCARTNIGPISRELYTDAFDSTSGPYVSTCGQDIHCGKQRCRVTRELCTSTAQCPVQAGNDCDFLVKCIGAINNAGGTCAGGGVGVNGMDDGPSTPVPVGPVASSSAATHVGGAFWVFGSIGLAVKGNTQVKQKFYNEGNLDLSKSTHIWGEARVGGAWSSGGNTDIRIWNDILPSISLATGEANPAFEAYNVIWKGGGGGTNDVTTAPTFAGTDFGLAAGSAGIDAALVSSETPLVDFENRLRGPKPDIGAHELGAPAPAACP
jgi:hypothetical protein